MMSTRLWHVGAVGGAALLTACLASSAFALELAGDQTQGSLGSIGYALAVDPETHQVTVCLSGDGEASTDGSAGSGEVSGAGQACIDLTPPALPDLPELPDTGITDPLTVEARLGVPTPDGVVNVDVSVAVHVDDPEVCVALAVEAPGGEPMVTEICLPPNGLPGLPGVPGLPGLPGLPNVPGLPELPGGGTQAPLLPGLGGGLPQIPLVGAVLPLVDQVLALVVGIAGGLPLGGLPLG